MPARGDLGDADASDPSAAGSALRGWLSHVLQDAPVKVPASPVPADGGNLPPPLALGDTSTPSGARPRSAISWVSGPVGQSPHWLGARADPPCAHGAPSIAGTRAARFHPW